ncbi:MAG: hypothetical protein ACI8XB_001928 [Patiriisocius sp.]|jgi:hypothetical protein
MKHKSTFALILPLFILLATNTYAQNPPSDHHHIEDLEEHACHSELVVEVSQNAYPSLGSRHHEEGAKNKMMCLYDNAGYASLTSAELVSYLLSTNEYDCVDAVLFDYDDTSSPITFSNANLQAVLDTLIDLGSTFDGTSAIPIHSLVTYVHVFQFHEFYNASISMDATSFNILVQAFDILTVNANLFDLNEYTAGVMTEVLTCIDYPGIRHRVNSLNLLKQIMLDFTVNDTWVGISDMTWVNNRWSIAFLMFRGVVNNDADYIQAIGNDPTFTQLMNDVAIDSQMRAQSSLEFICDNLVAEVARLASEPSLNSTACAFIGSDLPLFPRLDPNWLVLSNAMNESCDCLAYNACENSDSIASELDDLLFPNTYVYNDGALIFKATFDQDKADEMYYASRQVESQFFRMLQGTDPVTGDTNDNLSCVVFNNKTDYDNYAPYLYGISTNNGGMYIESRAEFYTWDRPASYSLSLEELFRHEFSHYLQGRYWIPELWGVNPLYADGRAVWIEEGSAELFTGSTSDEGIKLLTGSANRVVSDSPNWPTVTDVINSNYSSSGSIYYPYGNLLWYYIYTNDFPLFKEIIDILRSSDVAAFDVLMASLQNDAALAASFQSFLVDVENGVVPSWEPNTDWLPHASFSLGLESEILDKYEELTGDMTASVETIFTNSIRRFRLTSVISGTTPASTNAEAALQISATLDSISQVLQSDLWVNNFDYLDMHFDNLEFQNGVPTALMYIRGSLKDALAPNISLAFFEADNNYILVEDTVVLTNQSIGFYDSLQWNYPGGELMASPDIHEINVRYNTVGDYALQLEIFNGVNLLDEKTEANYIHVYQPSSQTYCPAVHSNPGTREITRVLAGGIDNNTGEGVNGYSDYSNMLMTLTKGESNPILVDVTSTLYVSYASNHIGVWLDYNEDGVFDNVTEKVVEMISDSIISNLGYYMADINVPLGVTSNVITMRVRHAWIDTDEFIDPCSSTGEGETEDYSVIFLDGAVSPVSFNLNVNLEGPYDATSGLMNDLLRDQDLLPLEQPYSALGYTVPNATTSNVILDVTGSAAIVDWILVELRDGVDPSIILDSQACLVQRDGTIVSSDGTQVTFNIAAQDVYIAIRHRNHFGIRTNQTYNTSGSIIVDFSDIATDIFGVGSMSEINNTNVLISGDANSDGQVNSIDKNLFWRIQNAQMFEYLNFGADFNLDGNVNSVDKNLFWRVNNSKVEQLD